MAPNATIVKIELQISDMDRHYYAAHALTLAQHPSETAQRLMMRMLGFALYAHERLEFGPGLSSEDEPDLALRDYTGDIELWIDVGQPDESRIRKACGRARQVVVLNYGGNAANIWWDKNVAILRRLKNLTVLDIDSATVEAMAAMVERSFRLDCQIADQEVALSNDKAAVTFTRRCVKARTHGPPEVAETFDAVIVGGGAAGLMCALTAGQRGRRVLVIEHANKVGKKILMSGGGRCNFTNTGTTAAQYLSANPHFCKSALARYTPWDFIAMVERHRIAYHEKELGQLFCDDSSKLIVKMLVDECLAAGVRIETGCSIERIVHEEGGSEFRLHTARGAFSSACLVIASGGLSIPSMGASGFGYELARSYGHNVLPTRAGLVPLTLSGKHQERLHDLSGVALPVTASCNGRSFSNQLLITHRGVSGPSILQISSYWQPGDDLRLDLLPGHDAMDWLLAQQRERPAAELKTVLGDAMPKRFAQRLCELWLSNKPMKQYNAPELRQLAATLGAWPLVASGTEGYRTAEVTLGGVDTDEVSSSTMMSKRVPGLYFIGEVIDVTGWLGGYNFQWAWASGHAAGLAV